jgi:adenylate cyclase
VAKKMGFTPWSRNPKFCRVCIGGISERGIGGAEVEISMLFADVRGSTTLAETMSPTEFASRMNRFYEAATNVLIVHDAMVDKFVGDEVVALFIPAFAGTHHAKQAIEAALALRTALGEGTDDGPWIPVGTGVHTATAYVGSVGSAGNVTDVTALGDPVNTTARLASVAAAGEVLVTEECARAADLDVAELARRSVELKGKAAPTVVYLL